MILGQNQQYASPQEALKHFGIKGMRWGVRKKPEPTQSAETSEKLKSTLGYGVTGIGLKKTDKLEIDTSKGYADIRPSAGIKGAHGRKMHQEMVDGLEELRREYPAVRDMKVEIAPMTHMPGGIILRAQRVGAAAVPIRDGEARILYNDRMRSLGPIVQAQMLEAMPGLKYPGYTGRHEAGHILAMAGGLMPPTQTEKGASTALEAIAHKQKTDENHRAIFAKHGLSFSELSKLGAYAASSPPEALAELHGHYATPQLRSQMSPDLQRKAKNLFDDLGGKK